MLKHAILNAISFTEVSLFLFLTTLHYSCALTPPIPPGAPPCGVKSCGKTMTSWTAHWDLKWKRNHAYDYWEIHVLKFWTKITWQLNNEVLHFSRNYIISEIWKLWISKKNLLSQKISTQICELRPLAGVTFNGKEFQWIQRRAFRNQDMLGVDQLFAPWIVSQPRIFSWLSSVFMQCQTFASKMNVCEMFHAA